MRQGLAQRGGVHALSEALPPQARVAEPGAAWAPGSLLRRVLWLAPPLFAIHNAEEGVAMARWAHQELPGLVQRMRDALPPGLLPPGAAERLARFQPPSPAEFWWAAALATAIPLLVYWLAAARGPRSGWTAVAVWLQAIFLVNVFVPHLALTLWTGRYTPGVVTALAVNLPVSWLFFRGALREGVVTRRALLLFGVAALLSYGVVVGTLLWLGRMLARALAG